MLTLLALTAVGLAQSDPAFQEGLLVLHPTVGSEIRRFPRYHSDRVHLAVLGNTARLDAQVQGRSARWLRGVDAWDSGGGTWFVTLYLEREDLDVSWEWQLDGERPRVLLTIGQAIGGVEQEQLVVDAGIEELVADAVPRELDSRRGASFHLMDGDALNPVLDPAAYAASWPHWEPEVPARYKVLGYHLEPKASMVAIDRFRALLTEVDDPRMHALALWRLGEAHQSMGLHREALSYFTQLGELEAPVGIDAERVQLARAQAAFGSHRWDDARDACARAWRSGAHDALVLECLGVSALATGHPAPAETGRQLARVAASSRARLLAGQLLLKDHRYEEAKEPLKRATDELEGDLWVVATMNLGDAHFHLRELEDARRVWRALTADQPTPAELAAAADTGDTDAVSEPLAIDDATVELLDLIELRLVAFQLVQDAPSQWAARLSDVLPYTTREGIVGAEALYLVAQLQESLDEPGAAAEALAELADRYPRLAVRTDAAARLARVWDRRVRSLAATGRYTELAAFHQATWIPALLRELDDTTALEAVVEAWRRMGAAQDALRVQQLIGAVLTRQDRVDNQHLLRTAMLYSEAGRPTEALDTIAFIRGVDGASDELGGRLDLLEGSVLAGQWQLAEAEKAWQRAMKDSATRLPAMAELARVAADEERCDEALKLIGELLVEPAAAGLPQVADGRVHLVAARCQLALGRWSEALVTATESAERAVEPVHERYALYLASRAAERSRQPAPVPDEIEGDGVWAALLREEQDQADFTGQVEGWFRR